MAGAGPFGPGRRVAVACSGGADSMALAALTRRWGDPVCFIVDHALRSGSAAEAALTAQRLAAAGLPARVLRLSGLGPGAGLAARARAARHDALAAACRAAALVDVLLGHHARDQAETVLLRREGGSGPAGLSGMAAVSVRAGVRLLRPLLAVPPARLRATARQAGLGWVEDPTNEDGAWSRTRLRRLIESDGAIGREALETARRAGAVRTAQGDAGVLAQTTEFYPAGYAVIHAATLPPEAMSRILAAIAGRPFGPPQAAVARLAARLRPATLGGIRVLPGGRLGTWLVAREPRAMAAGLPALAGLTWDGRFRLDADVPGGTLGPLGEDAPHWRDRSNLPSAILATLPAIRVGGRVIVPHLDASCRVRVLFAPPVPAAVGPFRSV